MSRPNTATWLLAGLAAIGHAAVGVLYAASGLLAPLWAIVLLGVWWLVLGAALIVLARRGSWWTPAVPVLAYGTWWLAITAGERLLGWTA